MELSPEKLAEYFALYGSSLKDWPQTPRAQAEVVRETPFFQHLLNQQIQFEMQLRTRHMEPPSHGFSERIIQAAARTQRAVSFNLYAWLQDVFAEYMLPRPAFVFPAVLLIGMCIGVTTLDGSSANNTALDKSLLEQMMNDEGDTL